MSQDMPLRVMRRVQVVAIAALVLSLLALAAALHTDAAAAQGNGYCDDPEYVENFFEGDRAACLQQSGCTICGNDDSGGGGNGAPGATARPELLAVPKSLRLGKLLKGGVRFRVQLVQADSAVRASLAMKRSKIGTLKRSGLAAGERSLTLKLSRKGKAKLRRALKRRKRVKTALKVSVSGVRFTKTLVVKR
jgi:hypothetical protein